MINPDNITKYNQTIAELEEVLLFWIAVAGKTAVVIATRIDNVLKKLGKLYPTATSPFDKIRKSSPDELAELLRLEGIGCFQNKARSMTEVANRGLHLPTCTCEQLEEVYGIGPKTARCFLIHSRPNVRHAGLDTHLLRFMREHKCLPPGPNSLSGDRYVEAENVFLTIADLAKMPPSQVDLIIWRQFRRDVKNRKYTPAGVVLPSKPIASQSATVSA